MAAPDQAGAEDGRLNKATAVDTPIHLMVNYLPQSVDEDKLRSMFSEFGNLTSCKLIPDKLQPPRHVGYGFVNYTSLESAQKAIAKYNGFAMDGKWLKVIFARQSQHQTKSAKLMLSGLPIFYTEENVRDMLKPFGAVLDIEILMTPEHESRGIANVVLGTTVDANNVINVLNESVPKGSSSRICVKFAEQNERPQQRFPTAPVPLANPGVPAAFYSGYPPVQAPPAFVGYGPIRSHAHYEPRVDPYVASTTVYTTGPGQGPKGIDPPTVTTSSGTFADPYAPGENPSYDGYCLFAYNIPLDMDENGLRELFQSYGTITNVKVSRDQCTQYSRGFGFVNFSNLEAASLAIQSLNGSTYQGRQLKVSFKRARNICSAVPARPPAPGLAPHHPVQPQQLGAAYQAALQRYHQSGMSPSLYAETMQAYDAYRVALQQQPQKPQQPQQYYR